MAELIEIKEVEERVILTAVSVADGDDTESSLDELEELVKTAGGQTVGRLIQNREKIHPGTYLGKGKIDELKELIWETDATGIVCDDELSPAQLRNLEDALETKVMDRTMVILDIFARHATTREGKLQVELAQLRYRRCGWWACATPCPVWAAASVPGDRVSPSWRSTAGGSTTGSAS